MWDFPRLLMVLAGLGIAVSGLRKKAKADVAFGCCFVGNALFGYLAKSNDFYVWCQWPFVIAMLAMAVMKGNSLLKRNGKAAPRE